MKMEILVFYTIANIMKDYNKFKDFCEQYKHECTAENYVIWKGDSSEN